MAFAESDLLLGDDKLTELKAALSTVGVDAPLQVCIDEAMAEVTRLTAGFVLEEASLDRFIRALALQQAYTLAGPVPVEVQKLYDDVVAELTAIARGDRPNLPVAETDPAQPSAAWGSRDIVL
jgi:hypothetical protein